MKAEKETGRQFQRFLDTVKTGLGKGKDNILIFGTGEAGKTAYRRLKRSSHIVSFLDNNPARVGHVLFRKPIHSPKDLDKLSYDRIVIASMHHAEIMAQLVTELKVPAEKIDVYQALKMRDWDDSVLSKGSLATNLEYFNRVNGDAAFRRAKLAAYHYEHGQLLENHVLYESYNGIDFAGNPYALFKYLFNNPEYAHLHHVIAMQDVDHPKVAEIKNDPRVTVVKLDSDLFIRYAQTCKYFINNVSLRPYLIKKEGQVFVNTWHGTPVKKLAADSDYVWEAQNVSRLFMATDYFISPNRYSTERLLHAYGVDTLMPGTVAEVGYPRNDLIFGADKHAIRRKLKIAENKKIIVFAPTWRGHFIPENTVKQTLEHYRKMLAGISEEWAIVVKFHTMVHRFLDDEALAVSAPRDLDTNELLAVADLLITDYSSLLFDFLITNKPMIFFAPDRQEYSDARDGFYMDLDELPGPICDTIEEVIHNINTLEHVEEQYAEQYADFQRRFVRDDDGRASERVANIVFKGKTYDNVYKLQRDKPNILIYPSSLAPNGITTSVLNLLRYVDYTKYNVVVLLPDNHSFRHNQRRLNKQAKVVYQPSVDGWFRKEYVKAQRAERFGFHKEDPVLTAAYRRNMRRIFADVEFDTVINFNGYDPSWAAKLCFGIKSKKKIIYLHNDMNEERKNKYPRLRSVFSLYRYYDKLICVSEDSLEANARAVGEYVKKEFGIDVVPKMDYVENLIMPADILQKAEELETVTEEGKKYYLARNPVFSNPGVEHTFTFPLPREENVNFITIGRMSPEKNQLRLLRSFHKVQTTYDHVRLFIVGDGIMLKELARFVNDHGIADKVVFVHHLHNPYPLLSLCDCFVLSSDIEGQGIVVLEALTLGKYVISTDIPGPHNLLKDGMGRLVARTSDALAEAMENFVEQEKRVERKLFDPHAYVERAMRQFEEKVL